MFQSKKKASQCVSSDSVKLYHVPISQGPDSQGNPVMTKCQPGFSQSKLSALVRCAGEKLIRSQGNKLYPVDSFHSCGVVEDVSRIIRTVRTREQKHISTNNGHLVPTHHRRSFFVFILQLHNPHNGTQ